MKVVGQQSSGYERRASRTSGEACRVLHGSRASSSHVFVADFRIEVVPHALFESLEVNVHYEIVALSLHAGGRVGE